MGAYSWPVRCWKCDAVIGWQPGGHPVPMITCTQCQAEEDANQAKGDAQ
ncbi:hypothetical protein PSP31121_05003 [Pandoraea sputorum]|uniref:Uncharacterized protein n=1 Tax=Pandoraea sputorum TaxID=93222 RepID=A0A5E5BI29_9BURK|nr:hypothetical protein PSP31121_05003 [Pandoraea sputorum]